MNHPHPINQDDVLAQGVEIGEFNGPTGEEPNIRSQKPKKKNGGLLTWIIGGVAASALITVGIMFFIGRGNSNDYDPGYAQIGAPALQPEMEAAPTAPAYPPTGEEAGPGDSLGVDSGEATSIVPASPEQAELGQVQSPPAEATTQAPVDVPAVEPGTAAPPPTPAVEAPVAASSSVPEPAGQQAPIDTQVQMLTRAVAALSSDVERLQQARTDAEKRRAVAAKRAATPADEKSTQAQASAPITGITLKAVVDNNAWLQLSNGESLMVTTGDQIPGLGTVKAVDPDGGVVRLADGRTLR